MSATSFEEAFSVDVQDRKVRLSIRVNEDTAVVKIVSIPEFEAMIAEYQVKKLEANAI